MLQDSDTLRGRFFPLFIMLIEMCIINLCSSRLQVLASCAFAHIVEACAIFVRVYIVCQGVAFAYMTINLSKLRVA